MRVNKTCPAIRMWFFLLLGNEKKHRTISLSGAAKMTYEANPTAPVARVATISAAPPRRLSMLGLFDSLPHDRSHGPIIGAVGLIALWYLRHKYNGVVQGAVIYMGRGLADLDPHGVGTDFFFRLDGQSSFSIFSKIVDALIPVFGLAHSAMLLTATALALWLAALAALAGQLTTGRLKWAILICVAVSSGAYGGMHLEYAESFATPRPFAEAGVLAALAALLAGSKLRAMAFILLAALFHPIMALAGAGALYVYMCLEDRRWIYLGVAGAVGILIAALLGLPLFSRLLERFDWNWSMILRLCASFLFPLTWKASVWAPIVINTATLGFAATAATDPIRRLFWSVAIASLGWLLVNVLLGDVYPLVLITQAQPWRAIWLLTLFGVIAMCFCVPRLWAEGSAGRTALALFVIAWSGSESGESALLGLAAIGLYKFRDHFSPQIMKPLSYCLGIMAGLTVLGGQGAYIYSLAKAWAGAPAGAVDLAGALTSSALLRTPLTILALAWAVSNYRIPRPALLGAATALVFLAVSTWNGGTEFNRALSSNQHPPELERMVAAHPGEVLWLGESQAPWVWLSRPNWVSLVQGASNVFSRSLTMVWRDRALALLDVDWIQPGVFTPWLPRVSADSAFPDFSREKIHKICARSDAPAWILGDVESPTALPHDVTAQIWRSPTKFIEQTDGDRTVWRKVQEVAVIDCSLYQAE